MLRLFLTTFLIFTASYSYAEKITVAFGSTLAPWVMADTNNGILIDLFKEAMEPLGYEIENVYFPYARRLDSYQSRSIDVVSDINQNNINNSHLEGHFSGIVYAYENYAYSLESRHYSINSISDLGQYSFLSWQGAKGKLGAEYDLMVANNPQYRETHDQKLQVKMLLKERVDLIQMDKYIFNYYRMHLLKEDKSFSNLPVKYFPIFGKSLNGFLFHSAQANRDFIRQIALMKKDGRYAKIFERYTGVAITRLQPEKN